MVKKKVFTVQYRRKKQGKTDYRNRLAMLKSGKPRLVFRKANRNLVAQVIQYQKDGDKVLLTVTTRELLKHGWNASRSNIPAAYLLGLLVAKKSPEKEAILDIGLQTPTKDSKLFAFLKGAVDGGLEVPHSDDVLPPDDRVSGKHIAAYIGKADPKISFQTYHKNGITSAGFSELFAKAKQQIMKEK
jgi:large subunit ribosomal protein L18